MRTSLKSHVTPTVLSSALMVLCPIWFVAAYAFHTANRHSKDGWSATPLPAMLALVIIPVLVAVLAMWLSGARYTDRQKLRVTDYIALAASAAPFVCVVVWFLMMI